MYVFFLSFVCLHVDVFSYYYCDLGYIITQFVNNYLPITFIKIASLMYGFNTNNMSGYMGIGPEISSEFGSGLCPAFKISELKPAC